MAAYAVGDLQGCFYSFRSLLEIISFDKDVDELWLVGDIVNRGMNSLEVIEWCYEHQKNIKLVLGNHDLHFLSIALSIKSPSKKDTLSKVLSSPRLSLFVEWLISTPLIQKNLNYVMSHAGLHPSWSLNKAIELSNSFCESLYKDPEHTLKSMYGNEPKSWSNDLNKRDQHRMTVNTMTRMRCLNKSEQLDFKYKGSLNDIPKNLKPWFCFDTERHSNETLITGHWSAIGYYEHTLGFCLDTGCVWGGQLTALSLDTKKIFSVKADTRDLA